MSESASKPRKRTPRKRATRALQVVESSAHERVESTPDADSLEAAVRAAIDSMTWLEASDQGMVALALRYARQIDSAGDDEAKVTGWMGPHLVNALKALGGAPGERQGLDVEREVKGKLAQMRQQRAK